MSHVQAIRQLIKSMTTNPKHHSIIIDGPPGWGKTTAVEDALRDECIKPAHVGAYSTPLNLYNFLFQHSDKIIVIDDCAKLFVDSASMAILKAATWAGTSGQRIVRWGSTSNRALASEFTFEGKFIIVCNSFPATPDGEAIKSRSFVRPITLNANEGKRLLIESAKDKKRFSDTSTAMTVADFLSNRLTDETVWKISYRMLEMGYGLAKDHPDNWRDLLAPKMPVVADDPTKLVKQLNQKSLKVKEQVRIFEEVTGMSRRTFFKYRQDASLTKTR